VTSEPLGRIRRAAREEAREIADVWLRSRHASIPAIPPPVHSDDEVRQYFATVVLPTRETWVVEAEGRIVALMVLHDDSVDQLYVGPDWTGRGLGSQLLALAKTLRPSGLHLWAFESNTGARRFYERHGFVAVERTDGDNEEGAPDVRYHWSIARTGYSSVTPRIVVADVAAQVNFLRAVFDATAVVEPGAPAEVRIGDSLILVSSATERDAFPAFLYVYVADADQTYQRAIAAGATTIEPPLDTPYGDRRAMVRDAFGNVFQIAHHLAPA
jgi:uncharacterized glyoxalase superfamily protein PhnB/GNAT superfamily N-acetyltransferase